jgi:AAHS family 4-hydroxybenzoate transporter-like MFS transporter
MLDTATVTSGSAFQERLDEGRLRAVQIRVFVLCMLVTMLDGIDNQSIGVVAPLMSKDLGLDKTALGSIFSVTQIGATVGALLFGVVGDRFGRKTAIMICVSVMTVFTLLTAVVPTFELLMISRFFAGLGLAGVFSSALAITSEFAPGRLRGTMVSIVYAGYPAGAALGGIMAAAILTSHDWRTVLYIAALMGAITLILVVGWLPESIRYLISKGGRSANLDRLLGQLDLDRSALAEPKNEAAAPTSERAGGFWSVFRNDLAPLTVLLCIINLFISATTKIMVVWFPTILTEHGLTVSQAALAQAAFNIGCLAIMMIAGWLVDRFGSLRIVAPALALGGVCVAALGVAGSSLPMVMIAAALIGVFVGTGAAGAQAMATRLFPVSSRSTGVGWCTSSGRFGQVLSPMLIGIVLAGGTNIAYVFTGLAFAPWLAAAFAVAFVVVARRKGRKGF